MTGPAGTGAAGARAAAAKDPLRTLVVDDDPVTLDFMVEVFAAHGCLVAAAPTAERALDLLTERPFDLLVSDIRLPGLTGLELLRAAKGKQPGVSVVLVTGLPSVNSAVFGLRHGAYDYLSKPVSVKDVQRLLERLRRDRQQGSGALAEPARLLEELARQHLGMEALFRIGELALEEADASTLIDEVLDYTVQGLGSDAALLLLRDADGKFTTGLKGEQAYTTQLVSLVRAAFDDLARTGGKEAVDLTRKEHPIAAVAVALPDVGRARGILGLARDVEAGAYLPNEKELLVRYGQVIALGLRNTLLAGSVESSLLDTIAFFVTTLESKDPLLKGHCARVSMYAGEIAGAMQLPVDQVAVARRVGLLHDLGKLVLLDSVLLKPGPLTPEEYALVRRHPEIGGKLLGRLPFLAQEAASVRHHLERFDGTGGPDGLGGDRIPLIARIVAVADAFDAMTSARPYRPALPLEQARDEISRCAGTQFDPTVAEAFASIRWSRTVEISRYYEGRDRAGSEPRPRPAPARAGEAPGAGARSSAAVAPAGAAPAREPGAPTREAAAASARELGAVPSVEPGARPPAAGGGAAEEPAVFVVARGHQELLEQLKSLIGDDLRWVQVIEDRRGDPTILPREGREGSVYVDPKDDKGGEG
jgi:response regulator RpfG family c-di-GMP phosphodiesterase